MTLSNEPHPGGQREGADGAPVTAHAVDRRRRRFVSAALCAPALAAALPASESGGPRPDAGAAPTAGRGYNLTEHIRTYYALAARF